jgi:hypothetical protein
MSQGTFWDGEEAIEKIESERVAKIAAKIRLTNLLEKEAAEVRQREKPRPQKPRKDFRIGAKQEEEVEVVEEKKVEAPMTAEHVAAQLIKLWKMGVIKGVDDPEAVLYAGILKEFGGTVRG